MATAATQTRLRRNPNLNFGTVVDQLGGIQVGSGIVLVNFDTDRRFHNVRYQVTAVNYTGGTGLAPVTVAATAVPAPGTDTITLVVNSFGIPTAATWVGTSGTNYTAGDTLSVVDATGKGLTLNVVSVSGSLGHPTALAVVNVGTPTAAPAGKVIGVIQQLVNGSPVRDTTAKDELNCALFNGETIGLGQLPIFYTEPWRNFTRWPAITSWDMAGQNTFAHKMTITPGYQQVNVVGTYEYDFVRNTVQGEIDQQTYQAALASNKAPAPVLHVIARHNFTPTLNAGVNILTGQQIPFNWPILRMHVIGSTPGDLTQSILVTDNLTAESGFIGASSNGAQLDQLIEELKERGFVTTIYDYSYVADKGQRISDCLKIASSLKWSLYSAISQGLTVLQERLQSRYE
jgi:hypothetical protein